MKAIQVKYLSATNTRGSRIKAIAEGVKPLIIGYDHALSGEAVYRKAAMMLCDKYNWDGELVGGQLPNNDYVFCFKNQ